MIPQTLAHSLASIAQVVYSCGVPFQEAVRRVAVVRDYAVALQSAPDAALPSRHGMTASGANMRLDPPNEPTTKNSAAGPEAGRAAPTLRMRRRGDMTRSENGSANQYPVGPILKARVAGLRVSKPGQDRPASNYEEGTGALYARPARFKRR